MSSRYDHVGRWALVAAALAAGTAHAQVPDKPKAPNVTTDSGKPVGSDERSETAGPEGPTLLQDFYLLEKIARFDRERIPERVVHAKGVGVHGEFVVEHDVTGLTKAAFLSTVGKKTPMFVRISTVVQSKGSADTARDVRGFALKFYTEEGNYDIVGNDIPVFFIRDAIKFPDVIHALKPSPVTNVQEPERYFDFFSATPESTHMLTWLFSDMGTPASYRMVDGFGVNTFKWVNASGKAHYIKYRWLSQQGTKFMTDDEAAAAAGKEPAYLGKEMFEALQAGKFPKWELQVQAVTPEDLNRKFDFDPLDDTKVWPDNLVGWTPVGTFTLNRWPGNYFEATEQVAFNTGAYVSGIEPSEDRMLQGRNFSYSDTQRHRLGPNYQQLPINKPLKPPVNDNQDGLDDHGMKTGDINYNASTKRPGRMVTDPKYKEQAVVATGTPRPPQDVAGQDFKQAGEHYRSMSPKDQDHLVHNLAVNLKMVKNADVVKRLVGNLTRADAGLGGRLMKELGMGL